MAHATQGRSSLHVSSNSRLIRAANMATLRLSGAGGRRGVAVLRRLASGALGVCRPPPSRPSRGIHLTMTVRKYTEKTVRITCGAEIYENWRRERRFMMAPSPLGPRDFTVSYAETGPPEGPLAVVVHGAPGKYQEFAKLMTSLTACGVRSIVPNFPKCPEYTPPYFRHSTEEKNAYFKAFLQAIGVTNIDCLISHSSGVYTAASFCHDWKHDIKSMAFFSPTGFHMMKSLEPWWLMRGLNYACQFPWSYSAVHILGNYIISMAKSAVDPDVDNHSHLLSVITLVNSRFLETEQQFVDLGKHPRPLLFAWSKHDRLIQSEVFQNFASTLGANPDLKTYWHYGRSGALEQKGSSEGKGQVLVFDSKTHFIFKYHTDLFAAEIEALIRRARSK